MHRGLQFLLFASIASIMGVGTASAQAVIHYYGSLTSARGEPASGSFAMRVSIFDAETAGTSLWTESLPSVAVDGGTFDAILGLSTPLSPELFQQPAFVEVSIDGGALGPRQRVGTAPLALFSEVARTAKSLSCQGCVSEAHLGSGAVTRAKLAQDGCSDNQVLTYRAGSGWTCGSAPAPFAVGTGLILTGGTLSLPLGCGAGQVLKWSGSLWNCADDVSGGPGLTSITAAGGLSGGTITTTGTIAIAPAGVTTDKIAPCQVVGQILKWSGAAWVCAEDVGASGMITAVSGDGGLAGGGSNGAVVLSIAPSGVTPDKLAPCTAPGQVLRWSGSAWVCSASTAPVALAPHTIPINVAGATTLSESRLVAVSFTPGTQPTLTWLARPGPNHASQAGGQVGAATATLAGGWLSSGRAQETGIAEVVSGVAKWNDYSYVSTRGTIDYLYRIGASGAAQRLTFQGQSSSGWLCANSQGLFIRTSDGRAILRYALQGTTAALQASLPLADDSTAKFGCDEDFFYTAIDTAGSIAVRVMRLSDASLVRDLPTGIPSEQWYSSEVSGIFAWKGWVYATQTQYSTTVQSNYQLATAIHIIPLVENR